MLRTREDDMPDALRPLVRRSLAVSASFALLCGCITTTGKKGELPRAPHPLERLTTRVAVGDCIFRQEPGEAFIAPLLAAVLPSLISHGLNRLGRTLEAAGGEQTWQTTAFTNFELSASVFPRCVHVVRGRFAISAEGVNDAWAQGTEFEDHTKTLRDRGLYLTAKPDFFFEGAFRHATDATVMSIAPVVVAFEKPLGSRALRADPNRHVMLGFAFHAPGDSPTASENPATDLVLGELAPGAFLRFDQGCLGLSAASGPSTAPSQPGGPPSGSGGPGEPPTASTSSTVPRQACPGESLWFKLTARPATLTPLSLTVSVSEVQGESAFLTFLGDVFSGSKDELEKLAEQALIESRREAASLARAEASHTLAVAFDQAALAALAALRECVDDPTPANSGAARIAQQSANLAAQKAGREPPFGRESLTPLKGTAETVRRACEAALSSSTL
jgi:hypothetical protein